MFETKSGGTFEVKELGDGAGWTITGYASTFGGQPDHTGDVIAKGAFAESIATRPTKFLYQHADPIGFQIDLAEDQHGLLGTWGIVPTALGADAHMLAKAGVLDSLSIGFITQDAEFRDDGVRVIKKVDLLEVSAVTFPANENAIITAVKADQKKAIGPHGTATTDAAWDGSAMWKNCANSAASLKAACAWVDPQGDPTAKSSYKFIHHMVSADGKVGAANLTACSTGIGVLNGGRGGTTIPSSDKAGVYRHLAKHLSDAGKEPSPLKSFEDFEASDLVPFDVHSDSVRVAVEEFTERLKAGADIRVKEGRAISEARRQRMAAVSGSLRKHASEIDAMLEETAPPAKADDPPTEQVAPAGINVAYELALRRNRLRGRVEIPA